MRSLLSLYPPIRNLLQGRPLLAVFQACLRCNSACGYCNLPLNEGRYEMTRGEIRRVFTGLYKDGLRFVFLQGGEPSVRIMFQGLCFRRRSWPRPSMPIKCFGE